MLLLMTLNLNLFLDSWWWRRTGQVAESFLFQACSDTFSMSAPLTNLLMISMSCHTCVSQPIAYGRGVGGAWWWWLLVVDGGWLVVVGGWL